MRSFREDIHLYSSKKIEEVLSSLEPRQQSIIRERFGLGNVDEKTRNDIAGTLGLTSTRIMQIEYKALRMLRHPSRSRVIKPVEFNILKNNPYITEEEKIQLNNLEDELWSTDAIILSAEQSDVPKFDYSKLSILSELSREFEDRKQKDVSTRDVQAFENITIEELDLSIRAYNILKRAGKDTVKDLLEMNQEGFNNVRNLGKKSMDEVIAKIEGYGFTFDAETGFKKSEVEEPIEGTADKAQRDYELYNIDGITDKTHDILKETGIVTLEQLTSKNISELSSMMSRSRCEKLVYALKRNGYILNEQGNFEYIKKEEPEEVMPQTRDEIENLSIYEMKLPSRVVNILKGRHVFHLRDITEINVDELINTRGIGEGIINEIKNKMKEFGYTCQNGRFMYSVAEEKSELVANMEEAIEATEQTQEPQEETRLESDILQEMKTRREQLEKQLAALEEQTKQAKALLAEYDKIIGDGKTQTKDEAPDFKDE